MKSVKAKFEQNHDLRDILLQTENNILAEANPYDNFWSCGYSLHDEKIWSPRTWEGKNILGDILMEVRRNLKP